MDDNVRMTEFPGDVADLELANLINAPEIQSLMDDFYQLTRAPIGIVDLKGRILVGVGWQEICTKFHRVHPDTCRNCLESDLELTTGVSPGEFRLYRCKNNMWDIATPLRVGGRHVGNLFMGQFFFDDEIVDEECFLAQARRYGFDEGEYLAALRAVPRLSRQTVDTGMSFLLKRARMLSQLGYANARLARSVEERDRLVDSLKEHRERLRRTQEIAHLGSWELDLRNDQLSWSDEVYRIFGLSPQEFAATYEAFLDRVHPDDRAAVDAAYTGSLREGGTSYEIEHRIVRRDTGKVRWVHEKCEHVRNKTGQIIRSIGMVLDITERKEAEMSLRRFSEELEQRVAERTRELEAAVQELRRSNEDLERFAYISSHDLQEPLRMVASFVQLLELRCGPKLDAKEKQYIQYAAEGAQRMRELIKDLLVYSRINTERRPAAPVRTQILLDGVLENLRLRIVETAAMITHDDLPAVMADESQLGQVFQNLIDNALKYRKATEPPRVHVSARRTDGEWLFSVRDNGIGIEPAYYDQVFMPFKRLHADRGMYPGSGIGLAIVKRIVERHGGRVYIDSTVGQGATFYFTLPAAEK